VVAIPFRLKICGVRTETDIRNVAEAGGDAVGLNCFERSARFVDQSTGKELADAATRFGVQPVALFVNASQDAILHTASQWMIAHVQLHGDETPEFAVGLMDRGLGVLRGVRLPVGKLEADEIDRRVAPWEAIGCSILLDADPGASFGGVGQKLDWDSIAIWVGWRERHYLPRPVFLLAGGLRCENVEEAIGRSGASGVDVASGVEIERGVKDSGLISAFCESAKRTLA
jgi:phosphoribosylanthranilate isomerase